LKNKKFNKKYFFSFSLFNILVDNYCCLL